LRLLPPSGSSNDFPAVPGRSAAAPSPLPALTPDGAPRNAGECGTRDNSTESFVSTKLPVALLLAFTAGYNAMSIGVSPLCTGKDQRECRYTYPYLLYQHYTVGEYQAVVDTSYKEFSQERVNKHGFLGKWGGILAACDGATTHRNYGFPSGLRLLFLCLPLKLSMLGAMLCDRSLLTAMCCRCRTL